MSDKEATPSICPMCKGCRLKANSDPGAFYGTYLFQVIDSKGETHLVRKKCDTCGGKGSVLYNYGQMLPNPDEILELPTAEAALLKLQSIGLLRLPQTDADVDNPVQRLGGRHDVLKVGTVWHDWTVLEAPHFRDGHRQPVVKVQCACGAIKIRSVDPVLYGKSKWCQTCGHRKSKEDRA